MASHAFARKMTKGWGTGMSVIVAAYSGKPEDILIVSNQTSTRPGQ